MRLIYNAPAILHKGALIVGDTHFGIEGRLRRRGIYDDGFSLRIFSRLKELVREHKARKLILLGDVKEDITALDRRTEDVLAKLSMLCEVVIVRGNHDGGIERCADARVVDAGGMVHGKLGLVHGHSWPADSIMECTHIISGHQHPMISMTDAFGRKRREPVWAVVPPDPEAISQRYKKFNNKIKLVLMPAFNPLVGSTINNDEKTRLGPLLNNKLFKLNHAIVFRLDGTCLGELQNIH